MLVQNTHETVRQHGTRSFFKLRNQKGANKFKKKSVLNISFSIGVKMSTLSLKSSDFVEERETFPIFTSHPAAIQRDVKGVLLPFGITGFTFQDS